MLKRTLLTLGCGLLAACLLPASSQAVVIYDYGSSAGSGYTLAASPADVADVGTLPALPAGQYYSVTGISVARQNGSTAGSFDVGYFLWSTANTASATSVFSGLLASGSFNRSSAGNLGSIFTTNVTFATPVIMQGGQTFGYQMEYAAPGTINLTTAAFTPNTIGSSGYFVDHGVTAPNSGSSPDTFFVDTDNDGKLVAGDVTSLSGVTGFSNVYLTITANIVVPEPGTNVALALGGLVLVGGWQVRRRSAARRA